MDMELARKVTLRSELREMNERIEAQKKQKKEDTVIAVLIGSIALAICLIGIAHINCMLMA